MKASPSDPADDIESWLNGKVASTFDAMKKDPSRGLTGDEVFRAIADIHDAAQEQYLEPSKRQ